MIPCAALVGIQDFDAEDLKLATSTDFWLMIRQRRVEGRSIPLAELESAAPESPRKIAANEPWPRSGGIIGQCSTIRGTISKNEANRASAPGGLTAHYTYLVHYHVAMRFLAAEFGYLPSSRSVFAPTRSPVLKAKICAVTSPIDVRPSTRLPASAKWSDQASIRGLKKRTRVLVPQWIEPMSLPFAIAEYTGKSEVVGFRASAVLLADDMIRLAAIKRVFFRDQAVLANSVGSSHDQAAQVSSNIRH